MADEGTGRPDLPSAGKPVAGKPVEKVKPRTRDKGPKTPKKTPKAAWPKRGSAVVELSETAKGGRVAREVKASGLPITLRTSSTVVDGSPAARATDTNSAASGAVRAKVLGRKAAQRVGVDGLLLTLDPQGAPGTVGATVDYSGFSEAFGGGYGSRLTLRELPACVLDTPSKKECRVGTPVETVNDTERQTLTAKSVELREDEPTVLAVLAEEESQSGDYKASKLSPSATWKTNLNTGDFTWSYGMAVPDVPGGLKPNVGLSYSSGSIDGRTGGTNNQSSWIGDGFHLWPGYIERRYKPCAEDDVKNADGNSPGDLCWEYDNVFLTFNGKGGELVPAGDDEWKLKNDDGTRIKRLTSSERNNGDNNNEYWELTGPDGIRYYFGYNRLPGWEPGDETTGSTWTAPVFGNESGEPCHAAAFEDSWCDQAWRWNLDYAVDRHGNAIAYYYSEENNSYGRNLEATDDTRYSRGGYLDRIEYGLKSSSVYDSKALARVDFTSSERCLPNAQTDCSSIESDAFYWYDTPWDLNCNSGEDCDQGRLSPSFWTRKRLTQVTTEVLADGAYAKVDSWKLGHRWGQADVDYQLLLDSIQYTGHTATTPITLPKTTFAYTQMANRLDKIGDGYAPFVKNRLSTVADEYGGQIDVNYSAPVCDEANLPTPETNTTRCFPQYIGGSPSTDPELQWFNKYVVTSVTGTDRTGGAPDQVTAYEYKGGAAWHYDDTDGLTREKFKTWSQWRGYGHVRVKTGGQGGAAAMKTQSDTYFLRGMDGDRLNTDGGTKNVTITLDTGEGDAITDHESTTGFAYKTVTYSGPGGDVLTKTVNRPWHHQTAKDVREWGTITANLTGTASSKTWTSLDDGAGTDWRTTSTATTYDTVTGRPVKVDHFGDTSTAADNRCTRTTYATNASKNIFTLPSRVETVAAKCSTVPDRSQDVISDQRIAYDGGDYGDAPTKGDVTATATLKAHDGTTATYLESGATFDSYGRTVTTTDLTADVTVSGGVVSRTARSDGRTSTTEYSPATGFPTQVVATTPPAHQGDASTAQTTTTNLGRLRGKPITITDTNGKQTILTYDALGRNAKVWLPNRRATQHPNYQFVYFVNEGEPVAVSTLTLTEDGGDQIPSYTIYDGFLRERQTQTPGPNGGRLLTDTFYDERGLVAKTFAPYYAEGSQSRQLFAPEDALKVETQTWHTYDGLGRETESRLIAGNSDGGEELASTQTIYGGDRTTIIPPDGGTATTTLTDARGLTTELRQHHQPTPGSAYDSTTYQYTNRGKLAKVTDPAGNVWTYHYDQLGRTIRTTDPDKGDTTSVYDDRSQLISTTDARDTTLVNIYDGLGRQTELRENTADGPLRAEWIYDTLPGAQGHLSESTRYVNGNAYTKRVTMYDRLYQPVRTATVIPPSEGALAGTYQTGTQIRPNGLVAAVSYSAAGSLPGGSYNYDYEEDTLRPISVFSGGFSAGASYSLTGQPLQYTLGASTTSTNQAWVTNTYEWGTRRLATSRVDRYGVPGVDQHNTYSYDAVGNVLSISDVSRDGTDTQCFNYDYLRRITQAWTQGTTTCASEPSAAVVGGVAAYWHSYSFDKVGNRLTETLHDTAGDPTQDVERTYTYPEPGQPQPHTLTSVLTKTANVTAQDTYGYDATGNTTTRVIGGDTQELTWDAEGRLAKVVEPVEGGEDKVTEYIYDAEGNRLIGRTSTETTLYLGHTEVVLPNGSSTPEATRYVPLGGGHQAVIADDRTVSFTIADHHGTGQLAINAQTLDMAQRRTLPYGGLRGEEPASWPGTKGFVGGTDDTTTTGLTHLGAREYDPATGRFISVDPIMDLTDPQQIHGYTYANNNPLTFSDPTGLKVQTFDGLGRGIVEDVDGDGYHVSGDVPDVAGESSPGSKGGTIPSVTITSDDSGAVIYNGVRIPPERELSLYHLADTYEEKLQMWATATCRHPDNQTSSLCGTLDSLGWLADPEGDILEILGVRDAMRCVGGDAASCVWMVVGVIPIGKVAKMAKMAKASKAGKGADCDSFVPGTEVLLADGSTKPIEDLKVGDKVVATDPKTGKTVHKTVTATIYTQDDKKYVDLTVTTHDGTTSEVLTTTAHHPFWSESEQQWLDAANLEPGMTLRTDDGDTVTLHTVRSYTALRDTYNLTVRDLHTYYVLAGTSPVLVHNCGGSVTGHPAACECASGGVPKVRNGKLAGDVHPKTNVPFDENGFPDFSAWRHPDVPDVRIELSGNRGTDFARSNRAAGLSETPDGYTWHHHQEPGLMQLIETEAHKRTAHTGGFSGGR